MKSKKMVIIFINCGFFKKVIDDAMARSPLLSKQMH